jgi:hypothetical protein
MVTINVSYPFDESKEYTKLRVNLYFTPSENLKIQFSLTLAMSAAIGFANPLD